MPERKREYWRKYLPTRPKTFFTTLESTYNSGALESSVADATHINSRTCFRSTDESTGSAPDGAPDEPECAAR